MPFKKVLLGLGVVATVGVGGVMLDDSRTKPTKEPPIEKTYEQKVSEKRQQLASGTISIRESIVGLEAKDRATIKGEEIAKAVRKGKVTRSNYEIEIVDIEPIDGGVQVFARAWQGKNQIGFGKDGTVDIERFRIFNPPILVSDLNGDIIQEWGEENQETGQVITKQKKLREDPKEALLQVIEHNLSVMKNVHFNEKIVKGKRGNTTSTFYSDVDGDGVAYHRPSKSGNSWSDVRNAVSSSNLATDGSYLQAADGGTIWRLGRLFIPFDTSAIDDGDTINSATVTLTPAAISGGGRDSVLVKSTQANGNALVAADYSRAGDVDTPDEVSGTITASGLVVDTGTDIAITDLTVISKTDYTKIAARDITYDIGGSTPTDNKWIQFYTSENTGTTADPKLVVEHEASVVPDTGTLILFN